MPDVNNFIANIINSPRIIGNCILVLMPTRNLAASLRSPNTNWISWPVIRIPRQQHVSYQRLDWGFTDQPDEK